MQYVIINNDKVPQHSLDKTYTYEEVNDYENLAVLINQPYVVVDVDNMEHSEVLVKILNKFNVKCNIMKTDKGMHFWFRSKIPLTNSTNINTPIGIPIDIKSWGKKSLATIKLNGEDRNWVIKEDQVDEIPFWLRPINIKKEFWKLTDGDGRDDALFTFIIPLLKLKFSKDEIYTIFTIINNYIFKDKLSNAEINKMFDNNKIFDETLAFFDKKDFLHHEFASWLETQYSIYTYNKRLYVYDKGVYTSDYDILENYMINKIPKLKIRQRQEVLRYLEIKCKKQIQTLNHSLINCINGLVNIETKELMLHDESIFTINQLPIIYNPYQETDENIECFLNDISDNKKNIRKLLEEIIGYCLLNDNRFQSAFILLGVGSNGKSIFLKMLMELLGHENTSALSLEELTHKFKCAELADKIANIGDDISSEYIADSSMFKKLVSGEKVIVERKHSHPFGLINRAKFIFSANTLPPMSDKSYGLYRRLIIVPFLNKFIKNKNLDPLILNKITTPTALTHLLNIGIEGLNRVIKQGHFSTVKETDELIQEYELDNNSVLAWLQDQPQLKDREVNNAYIDYKLFCASNHLLPVKRSKFINEIQNKIDIKVKRTTRNSKFLELFEEKRH